MPGVVGSTVLNVVMTVALGRSSVQVAPASSYGEPAMISTTGWPVTTTVGGSVSVTGTCRIFLTVLPWLSMHE